LLVSDPLSRAAGCVSCAARDREVAALRAENVELARRVAWLERIISRHSQNSSLPPSSDDVLPGRDVSIQVGSLIFGVSGVISWL
jgi:hypothetical protein